MTGPFLTRPAPGEHSGTAGEGEGVLVAHSRPRNLYWYHAGALLFGDWGTSRLYVLGLALFLAGGASLAVLAAVGVLMLAVAWSYVIVCRSFPDGGGVYAAARAISPALAVVGATLLLGGFIATVAISVVEALHYFGVPGSWILPLSLGAVAAIVAINWFGARNAGRFALIVALTAGVTSAAIALAVIPFMPHGLRVALATPLPPPGEAWITFVRLCLAMAGIEAVANMTGLMHRPVERTARRTIWPVAGEVIVFNLVFAAAAVGVAGAGASPVLHVLPWQGGQPTSEVLAYRDTAMKVLAIVGGQHWLGPEAGFAAGKAASIVFGLLLLSAANTAIMAMVSVLFAMGRDRELPAALTRLNYSGVPGWALLVACALTVAVLAIAQDVELLARLYVVGVCGAVTTNVLACACNRDLTLSRAERTGMWGVGAVLMAVTGTILATDRWATTFAGVLVGAVLVTRHGMRQRRLPVPLPVPELGWLEEIRRAPAVLDPTRPRIMLAARGRYQAEFAVDLARRRGAVLFALYVRQLRLMDVVPGQAPRLEDDPEAQQALGTVAMLARRAGVPFVPIYVVGADIAEEILDYTVTFNCDTLIMGKTRRAALARRLEGDVVAKVAQNLPESVALVLRAPEAPFTPGEGVEVHRPGVTPGQKRDGGETTGGPG